MDQCQSNIWSVTYQYNILFCTAFFIIEKKTNMFWMSEVQSVNINFLGLLFTYFSFSFNIKSLPMHSNRLFLAKWWNVFPAVLNWILFANILDCSDSFLCMCIVGYLYSAFLIVLRCKWPAYNLIFPNVDIWTWLYCRGS